MQPANPAKNWVGSVSNTALVTAAGHGRAPLAHYRFMQDPKTGVARPVIPNLPGEDGKIRLWPFGSWFDAATHTAYLYYGRIKLGGSGGPLDFKLEGFGLARANTSHPDALTFTRLPNAHGDLIWWRNGEGPQVGAAVITRPGDPYLYLICDQMTSDKHYGSLARVRRTEITSSTAYEYLSGSSPAPRWSANPAESVHLDGLSDFPSELTVSYNAYLGGYLAVFSEGIFSQKVALKLAPEPWGPYRLIGEIGTPHQAFSNAFCYAGKEHPELSEDGGKTIYVTFVDNLRYWLQLLKVTLEK
jgi:hypothetical protein